MPSGALRDAFSLYSGSRRRFTVSPRFAYSQQFATVAVTSKRGTVIQTVTRTAAKAAGIALRR